MSTDEQPPKPLPEDEPVLTPEQQLGAVVDLDGIPYRYEAILGSGTGPLITFHMTNTLTGEGDKVLKIPREYFDPKAKLEGALNDAVKALDDNPDRVVKICNMILALDPNNEVAAFDKGVALMTKGLAADALEAFDLAIAISPSDVWNWLQKATCLAALGRDIEARDCLLTIAGLDAAVTRTALAETPGMARKLKAALHRLSSGDPADFVARRALAEYFR